MNTLQGKSVMVLEDDRRMLRALEKVLTGEGATVISADWAGDALESLAARKQHADLVITDLRMPFVSGMTVVYSIHKIFPSMPIIVLTAFGSSDVKAECLRQGAAAFLEKPLDTAKLMAAIGEVFASRPSNPPPAQSEMANKAENSGMSEATGERTKL